MRVFDGAIVYSANAPESVVGAAQRWKRGRRGRTASPAVTEGIERDAIAT